MFNNGTFVSLLNVNHTVDAAPGLAFGRIRALNYMFPQGLPEVSATDYAQVGFHMDIYEHFTKKRCGNE